MGTYESIDIFTSEAFPYTRVIPGFVGKSRKRAFCCAFPNGKHGGIAWEKLESSTLLPVSPWEKVLVGTPIVLHHFDKCHSLLILVIQMGKIYSSR